MKITRENISELPIEDRDKNLLGALLVDLDYINTKSPIRLWIYWQDWHNEYSCERVDPCPDYYGYYSICYNTKDSWDTIGVEMTLDGLNQNLCTLYEFCEYL